MPDIKPVLIGSGKGTSVATLGPQAPFMDAHGVPSGILERGILLIEGPDFPDSQIMTAGCLNLMLGSIEHINPSRVVMPNPLPAIEIQDSKTTKARYPPFIDTVPGAFKKKNQRQKRKRNKW